jgi:hypothetical protein
MRSLRLCIARLHRRYVRFARTLKPRQSSSHGAFETVSILAELGRKRNGGFEVCGRGKLSSGGNGALYSALTEPTRWAVLITQIDRVSDASGPISADWPCPRVKATVLAGS